MTAAKRNYHQYCGLASALDVIGERWTLLVIRELMMGPRHYGELLADLPGMGTNLLADRLRFLADQGIVRRVDVKGTGSRLAYELTEAGSQLRPFVLGLARWGLDFVGDVHPDDTVRPHWGLLAVESMLRQEAVADLDECYEFHVDDEIFHIEVTGGRARAVRGAAAEPATVAKVDSVTFVQIGSKRLTPMTAMLTGRLVLEGDVQAVLRCCDLLGLDAGGDVAATGRPRRGQAGSPKTR
jgi:DNA-binding HxlR family transcriptional regulator